MITFPPEKPIIVAAIMEHWNDVISFNQMFLSKFIFRGQANAEWNLSPSLERMVKNHHPNYIDKHIPNIYEERMLDTFKYKYPLYANKIQPLEKENVEWLTLMQHFGSPTRLLDFSDSIFVALYMALDGAYAENSAIWAVNKFATQKKHLEKYFKNNNTSSVSSLIIEKFLYDKANDIIGHLPPKDIEREILPVYPHLCNERISIQQGLFLMATDLCVPFYDVFCSFFEIEDSILEVPVKDLLDFSYIKGVDFRNLVLFKIIIPKKFKWELTLLLNQMNITAETLYPGLSGLAKSLSVLQLRDTMNYLE